MGDRNFPAQGPPFLRPLLVSKKPLAPGGTNPPPLARSPIMGTFFLNLFTPEFPPPPIHVSFVLNSSVLRRGIYVFIR